MKLHELLAVEGTLKGQADKTRKDLAGTFEKKRHLFTEKVVTFKPNEEGMPTVTEEQLDLQSKVSDELAWLAGIWNKALDVSFQIAEANTLAKADLLLEDGTLLATDVPATALLELEKRVNEIFELVGAIPTLDPAKGFQLDSNRGEGIYKARVEVRVRTKKVIQPLVLAPATDKHPAQVDKISVDVPTGLIETREWSALITPSEKARMLERVERLRRGIKAARARANSIDIANPKKIGDILLGYAFKA